MNKVIFAGNLVADPKAGKTKDGKAWAQIRVAVNRRFSADHKADFIPVIAWGKTAEFISGYFVKGKPICITGSLQNREYTDKDGVNRTVLEVLAEDAEFIGPKDSDKSGMDEDFSLPGV